MQTHNVCHRLFGPDLESDHISDISEVSICTLKTIIILMYRINNQITEAFCPDTVNTSSPARTTQTTVKLVMIVHTFS